MNKHKENIYEMTNNLPPNLKKYVLSMTDLKTEEELAKYLNNIIDNGKLDTIFNIAAKEFNIYINSNLAFEFHTWHNKNRLEFQQIREHIYMSSGVFVPLYSFYAILLYQADHLNEEPIKRKCFQNLLGIIMDSCLWNCEPVTINAFEFVLNEVGNGENYLSLAGTLTCASLCFACLHEMAHFYLHHDNLQLDKNKYYKLEYEADKLAYKIILSILEKNKNEADLIIINTTELILSWN